MAESVLVWVGQGWKYRMVVHMLEIYNEEVRDLLGDGNRRQHTISHDASGRTTVSDITLWEVNKPKDFEQLYNCAMQTRCEQALAGSPASICTAKPKPLRVV